MYKSQTYDYFRRLMIYGLRLTIFLLLLCFTTARAQDTWPSPEVEQMYQHGRDYLMAGNTRQAIAIYEQAIQLAPNEMVLYRDLGKAYYLSGKYDKAEKTLEPLLKSPQADAQSYQVMAACMNAAGEKKKAKSTLQKGIERFPKNGLLYHDMGKMYEEDNEIVDALKSWLDGIHYDPAYHVNYYEAARTYMNTNKVIWAILYGEAFVNIEHETPRATETRKLILNAYKSLYSNSFPDEIPQFGKAKKDENINSFEDAVRTTYKKLSPVVSDGITVESLTMLRTRFLMEWFSTYNNRYPFSLFLYQDNMLRNGYFDIYNQWLLGKADNEQEYESWNKFHTDVISRFSAWQVQNPLHPEVTDFYNDKRVDDIFPKRKK
jgi:tetratricopeptide (TPR) repeat protein